MNTENKLLKVDLVSRRSPVVVKWHYENRSLFGTGSREERNESKDKLGAFLL